MRYLAVIVAMVRRRRRWRMVVVVMVVIARRRLGRRLSGCGLDGLHHRGAATGEGQQGGAGEKQCGKRLGSSHLSFSSFIADLASSVEMPEYGGVRGKSCAQIWLLAQGKSVCR